MKAVPTNEMRKTAVRPSPSLVPAVHRPLRALHRLQRRSRPSIPARDGKDGPQEPPGVQRRILYVAKPVSAARRFLISPALQRRRRRRRLLHQVRPLSVQRVLVARVPRPPALPLPGRQCRRAMRAALGRPGRCVCRLFAHMP
jgi:hypothetical protein